MPASLSPSWDPIAFHAHFRPEALACIDLTSGESLTYRDFNSRTWQAASALASQPGCAPGQRVAIVSRNSADVAILSAAAERAGLVFVPLNWRLSAPELADILCDCTPALLLVQSEFEGLIEDACALAKAACPRASLAEFASGHGPSATLPEAPFSLDAPSSLDAPCIILYTSGTTGRAKGVVITRENALYSSLNFAAVAGVDSRAVLLCDSPMFHTVGLVAITRTALQQGATLAVSDRFVPGITLTRISDARLGVTHYFVVPQMVEALMRDPGIAQADFSRIKALFSGGGPLSPDLVKSCIERGVLLINGYGMSEIGSGIHMPLNAAFIAGNPETVGFRAPYLDVKLANAEGASVAHGEVGEIWMRGPSISPGYWNQPEATAASRHGDWFRSGDLARQQADGAYVIVDRLKDMYISGGENVYPAEVETALKEIEGVESAAVIGVADDRWGETGCAFIQLKPGAAITEPSIRQSIGSRLARYKQPAHILIVDVIPRTGSGKARKNLLRDMYLSRT